MANNPVTQHEAVKMAQERNLHKLNEVKPLYMLPTDPLAEEVLIPGFQAAEKVDCMVGFFSSEVLASLAPGLAAYIASSENSFRLIISPLLRPEDQAAIEEGLKSAEEIAGAVLEELTMTEDLIQRHALKCLSWLLKEKRIEIKIALMKGALFHPKVWLFVNGEDVVAAHGSSNVTYAGIRKNIEQMTVSRSWQDSNQSYIATKLSYEFGRLWDNKDGNCIVVSMPAAIKRQLLRNYNSEIPPTEEELNKLYKQATRVMEEPTLFENLSFPETSFTIPSWLKYDEGPFGHQGKAVNAWCEAGYRGVLEMATGSGKTITSMISAYRLYEKSKPLLIVVAAPYVPLIEQWCDEIAEFGLKPVNLTTVGGAAKRARTLQKLKRRFRTGLSDVEVVVVSHDTLCTPEFFEAVSDFDGEQLLIADEAHNLGRALFIENPPEFFKYRLGLSATPIRQYDEEGTGALFEFFGPVAFKFTLEEAIGNCLVEYDYYLPLIGMTFISNHRSAPVSW